MASYLRPRRGKYSEANSILSNTGKLKQGEIFFEVPAAGVGKGQGRLMMGDGTSNYSSLKPFLAFDMNNVQTFSNVTVSDTTNINSIIASINPASTLANNLNRIKLALLNLSKQNSSYAKYSLVNQSLVAATYNVNVHNPITDYEYILFVLYNNYDNQAESSLLLPINVYQTDSGYHRNATLYTSDVYDGNVKIENTDDLNFIIYNNTNNTYYRLYMYGIKL